MRGSYYNEIDPFAAELMREAADAIRAGAKERGE